MSIWHCADCGGGLYGPEPSCPKCGKAGVHQSSSIWAEQGVANYSFQTLSWPTCLHLGGSGISINLATGEVTIPEGLPLSDASRAIWDGVRRLAGQKVGFE